MFEVREGNQYIDRIYNEHDNFYEITLDASKEYCLVFFSSNGLYFPNEYEIFHNQIEVKDRFEWMRLSKSKYISEYAGKIIFLRDVYKSWYVTGINKEINSIDKLCKFLSEKTKGYKVIMVGGSAGGYAATICGLLTNAERIISFGGQFSLYKFENSAEENWQLKKYLSDETRQKYYDLKNIVSNNKDIPIFYFYAGNCEEDVKQWNHIKDVPNIYEFAFNTSRHANTTYPLNNAYLVTQSQEELLKLHGKYKGKLIERNSFCIQTVGFWSYLNIVRILFANKIRKMFTKNRSNKW